MSDSRIIDRYGPAALIAGAANGIGLAFARLLIAEGIDVVALDHDAEASALACEELNALGPGKASPAVVDLSATDVVEQVTVVTEGHDIGLLVYCAASIPFGRFDRDSFEAHERAVAVNCRGPVLLSRLFAEKMVARGRGGIILLASMAAYQGNGWVATYAGTKALNLILAESLWWELKEEGVDVLGLAPGATDTKGLWSSAPTIADRSSLADPADVAREGMDALGQKPSHVCGEDNQKLREALDGMDRAQSIDLMSGGTRAMCGD